MGRKRNALLAQPPAGIHALGVGGSYVFQQAVGRPTRMEDYQGVHTTGSPEIAGVYAMGAWQEARKFDSDAYPVIVTLDVSGLRALPDVDAIARAASLLEDGFIRGGFEDMDLQDAYDMWEVEYESIRTGADINDAVMEVVQYSGGPMGAFEDDEAWRRWVETGDYTDEEASRLVDQRRYMEDFDWDRVVKVDAMRPWWPVLTEDVYDDASEEQSEKIEEAGWKEVTVEDVFDLSGILDLKTIARGEGKDRDVQFHGTSSWYLARAFPELSLPPDPFPIHELASSKLKAKLLR